MVEPPAEGPAPHGPAGRLRFSMRSLVLAVVLLGLTLVTLRLVAASGRVIGWVLVAALLAGLLYPAVTTLARRLPRGAALALVVLSALGLVGVVAWAVIGDVTAQLDELQDALPAAARELERSDRFGEAARDFDLAQRAEEFVDELPERLRGGTVQDALRSAATRGVAFLATGVLTIFFLIHGPRLLAAAADQLPRARQEDAARVASNAYRRSWRYVCGSLVMAVLAAGLAYACAAGADLPAEAPLALWMGLLDLIPLLGAVLGGVPLVLLALADSPLKGAVIAVVLVGWQLVEAFVLQRRLERVSVHIGPFVTIAVGMVGLELYGIGGAVVAVVVVVVAAAALDEVAG